MDIERAESFYPALNLAEEAEKISYMKTALRDFICEHERNLQTIQRRLKAGKRQLEICTQESNAIDMQLSVVEATIAETLMVNQELETEALKTVKETRNIKRKIIALKSDIQQQETIIRKAKETMNSVRKICASQSNDDKETNGDIQILPDVSN